MSGFLKYMYLVAAFIAAAVSCTPELEVGPEIPQNQGAVVYSASLDGDITKVVLDGNRSMWRGEEWIQIAGRNGNYWLGSENISTPSASATFTYNGGSGGKCICGQEYYIG